MGHRYSYRGGYRRNGSRRHALRVGVRMMYCYSCGNICKQQFCQDCSMVLAELIQAHDEEPEDDQPPAIFKFLTGLFGLGAAAIILAVAIQISIAVWDWTWGPRPW